MAGYDSQQQRGNGPYFLHIENLPRKYTWQDLKDLIRRQASHGIWTDMAVLTNGQTGGKGHARVQRVDEACKLYKYLTENIIENRRLVVHLWDTSAVPAVFVRCNCPINPQPHPPSGLIAQMAVDPGWHTFNITSPSSMAQPSPYLSAPVSLPPAPVPPPQVQPLITQEQIINQMAMMRLDPRDPSHVARFKQYWQVQQAQQQQQQAQYLAQQYPMYVASSTGMPINVGQGHVRVEARGVFVSGLNYKARTRDIESHFCKAGDIVRVELQKDAQTGKSKGNATVQYASAEDAQRACDMFHGAEFMRMRLNVRPDKERVAVNSPLPSASSSTTAGATGQSTTAGAARASGEPIIVNGSQVRAAAMP